MKILCFWHVLYFLIKLRHITYSLYVSLTLYYIRIVFMKTKSLIHSLFIFLNSSIDHLILNFLWHILLPIEDKHRRRTHINQPIPIFGSRLLLLLEGNHRKMVKWLRLTAKRLSSYGISCFLLEIHRKNGTRKCDCDRLSSGKLNQVTIAIKYVAFCLLS